MLRSHQHMPLLVPKRSKICSRGMHFLLPLGLEVLGLAAPASKTRREITPAPPPGSLPINILELACRTLGSSPELTNARTAVPITTSDGQQPGDARDAGWYHVRGYIPYAGRSGSPGSRRAHLHRADKGPGSDLESLRREVFLKN